MAQNASLTCTSVLSPHISPGLWCFCLPLCNISAKSSLNSSRHAVSACTVVYMFVPVSPSWPLYFCWGKKVLKMERKIKKRSYQAASTNYLFMQLALKCGIQKGQASGYVPGGKKSCFVSRRLECIPQKRQMYYWFTPPTFFFFWLICLLKQHSDNFSDEKLSFAAGPVA